MEKEMVKTTKYINLPKYLIIFIENGFRFSKSNVDNLDNFEVGIEEGFDNKYCYQLYSIITKQKENYDYYNRNQIEFTKNEELSTTFSLQEICEQDIIGLYYYETNNNNNIGNLDPPSTRASSAFNGNEGQQNNQSIANINNIQNSNNVNPIPKNNFFIIKDNNNSNGNQINNFLNFLSSF
jgi:hypothetical protein